MGRGTRERKLSVISALVAAGAHCFAVDRYGSQPWHYAHDEAMRLAMKGPDFRLHKAILNQQLDLLARHLQALEYPEQINEWGPDGNTPLHVAACVRSTAAIQALVAAGADPNERNEHGTTALHTAASVLSEEVADLLLQAGARIDVKSILVDEYSSKGGNWVEAAAMATASSSSPRGSLSSPTPGSDGSGSSGGEGKPSPRSRKEYKGLATLEHETPLHVAVRKGALSMTRFFLGRGASVDATDRMGKTCLHVALDNLLEASRIGNAAETQACLDLVRLLLESGACPVQGNLVLGPQRTTLHWAAQHGHVDALEVLVAHTFGRTRQQLLDAQDERQETALMVAAKEGKAGCLEALLRNGADATLQNKDGKSARDLAEAHGMAAAVCIIDTFATFASMA